MANRPLVDWAIERVEQVTPAVAVNVHHRRDALEAYLAGRVHLSVEAERPLGTAGALGQLRDWLDGRAALVVNGDTWCPAPLGPLLEGWDGERIRVMVAGDPPLGPRSRIIGSLQPWPVVARLPAEPWGLWERVWRAGLEAGTVEALGWNGPFADCGTPADYLAANLLAVDHLGSGRGVLLGAGVAGGGVPDRPARPAVGAGGGTIERSVVGAGARIDGSVLRSVVWPGAVVSAHEHLVDAIRADRGVTVFLR